MPKRTIVDAGPLVSFLASGEEDHEWAKDQFKRFSHFVTCEAVLAEACARLAYLKGDPKKIVELVDSGALVVDFNLSRNTGRVLALMKKYSDLPMDFADACIVVMTEAVEDCQVVTLDKNDFSTYRRHGRAVIPTVMP